MVRHAWTVVCDKTITDRDTNCMSLDTAEQMNITMPATPITADGILLPTRIDVASLWYRAAPKQEARAKARMRIVAPDGTDVGISEMDIDLTAHTRTRTVVKVPALPLPKSAFSGGWYFFVIELEQASQWMELARVPLEMQVGAPSTPVSH